MTRSLTLLVMLFACLGTSAQGAPPENFEARVEALRLQFGVPGLALAIVEQGEPTLVKGFGVRRLGTTDAVDAATIFPTGSTGKAVTAAALALLVDEGRLDWDDKVIDHLPWFRMHDPWVTREITVRDLLVHRAGLALGAGDLLFVPRSNLTRAETVRRMAHIKPAHGFRSTFAYSNLSYVVAGQLIEEVSGLSWEDFVTQRLLRPGGMHDSTSHGPARFEIANRAFPHARLNGGIRGAGDLELLDERDELGRNGAPAGGLAMSARDLARWLQVQLARGALPGGEARLLSERSVLEMWTPVVTRPIQPLPDAVSAAQPTFDTYALGWTVRDYLGAKTISHGGGVFGSITVVMLIPEHEVGFAIVINSEEVQLLRGLMYELLDHYLDAPWSDWPTRWAELHDQRIAGGLARLAASREEPVAVGPSLPLERYAGDFADPWYGQIHIRQRAGRLEIDFPSAPRMTGALEHWQYDTFVTRFTDHTIEPAYVTFALDASGGIERVTMKAVSPLADFSYDYHHLEFRPVGEGP